MTTILRIDGSARTEESVTRQLTDQVVERLLRTNPGAEVVTRELLDGLPLLSAVAVSALGLANDEQTPEQATTLATSAALIQEFLNADFVVLGSPVYNFSVPAAVKAYIDQISRAGRTFRYTETGAVGLVSDRPTYIVSASGGTEFGSDADYATGYLTHFFGFLGITNVHLIGADMLMVDADAALGRAHAKLDQVLPVDSLAS